MPWSPYWSGREYWSDFMDAEQKAKAGDPKAQLLYSQFLVQQEGESTNAMLWLRKSTDLGYLPGMNGLAWMLATSTNESIRDGAEAVHWAERLVQRDGSKTGTYLDTLAAAYAEQGRWDDAIAAQRKAVSVLTPDDTMIKTSIVARLQLYLSHQKARE
jgi:TPR repeat protein